VNVVEIVPYQESWSAEFQQIASVLKQRLGELALRIDHIGSTAVPGLAAKDIIDVQITVAALDEQVILAMESLEYIKPEGVWHDHIPPNFVGPDSNWEKLYFREPLDQRLTNTHVRVQGRANQRYPLLFRDYLRAHPETAAAYAELKRRLAQHLADPQTYPYVKDPAVDLIYFAAEAWARESGWEMRPSDAQKMNPQN
jgi:GrpB-like predicted nucleotidyltransferase (UPF0157 family)